MIVNAWTGSATRSTTVGMARSQPYRGPPEGAEGGYDAEAFASARQTGQTFCTGLTFANAPGQVAL